MFSASYETASTTLRWAIAYLVHNPGCQTEILNQLDEKGTECQVWMIAQAFR